MKRIIVPLVILSLISFALFVNASWNPSENEITVIVVDGWNLIPTPTWEFDFESRIQMEDFKYGFIYDPNEREYALAWRDADWVEEEMERFPSTIDLYHSSMWIYSERQDTLTLRWTDSEKEDYSIYNSEAPWKLDRGWNFIFITPEFIGEKFSDIKGTCEIEKIHGWLEVGGNNQWDTIEIDEQLHSGFVGEGFVLKVSDVCTLGEVGVTPPPSLPN